MYQSDASTRRASLHVLPVILNEVKDLSMNKNRGRLLVFCEIPRFARDDRRQQMQPTEVVRHRCRGAAAEGRELGSSSQSMEPTREIKASSHL